MLILGKMNKTLRVAIVGGGRRCKEILEMVERRELKAKVIGVADINPDAEGIKSARERGIYTTADFRDLYKLQGLDLIIELTGDWGVYDSVRQTMPYNVQLIGHIGARLFWDIISDERRLKNEYMMLAEKMKVLAERDPLTGLFNRRRINELLENEIQRARRKEEVFSVMMLDVDDLKLINDAYGHLAGDKLLKNIANLLKNSCRSVDLIGRYGGDEFLIILPYTDGEKAKNIAQRICEKVREQRLEVNGNIINIPIRLSIGVATYPFDSMVSQELITLADKRMYKSKQFGKTVVSVSVPEIKEYLLAKRPTLNVLEGLVTAVNGKDHYTKAHSELVTKLSLSLAKEINLPKEEMEALRIAALLHDIGKIGIPESILRKPGPLEKEEFELIKQHPRLGAMMLNGPPPYRDHVIDAIKYHHERYDGKGYPEGLKGKDIPLLARIIGIADAYSAMITDRPYRKALTKEEAIAELKKGAGTQFDPELVDKFIKCLEEGKI